MTVVLPEARPASPSPRDRAPHAPDAGDAGDAPPESELGARADDATAAVVTTPDRERRRGQIALASVTTVALLLNTWALTLNGLGNQYYAAATRSMTTSWSNFFFASLDPGGFISVDKPPVALWAAALSARLFGVNSWSVLLPSALAGTAAVAVLWCTVRRRFGIAAATIAALVLALSPINVAVNRLNLPEPFLILFLVSAVWAIGRALESRHALRWLVLAGGLVGVAFNTKMLAAFVPVPALGLGILVGTSGWWARLKRAAVFGASALMCSAPWIVIVDLIPAGARPYVGGSTDNTVWDLVLGYNGFGRVTGGGRAGGPPGGGAIGAVGGAPGGAMGGAMGGAGGIFGGTAGPWRLFSDALGGQIAWVLPVAVLGLVAGFWVHRRDRLRRSAVVLWAGWLALYAVVFSMAGGTFHAYYTSVMAPAIAALVGIGVVALVPLLRRHRAWWAVVGALAVGTVGLQIGLSNRAGGFYGWLRPVVLVAGATAVVVIAAGFAWRRPRVIMTGLTVALAAALLLPAGWSVSETANPVLNSTLPQAGPRSGSAGSSFGSVSSNGDPALAAFLRARRTDSTTWDVAVSSAQVGSGLIADEDISVMAIGGFMGTDNSITVERFAEHVASGAVRYVLTTGSQASGTRATGTATGPAGVGRTGGVGGVGGGGPGGGGAGAAGSVLRAVTSACTPVTTATSGGALPSAYSGTLFDCAGKAVSLRQA